MGLLRRLRWALVFIVLLVLVLKSLVSTIGYPRFVCRRIARGIAGDGAECAIGGLRGDPFTSLEINDLTYTYKLPSGTLEVHLPQAVLGLRRRSLLHGSLRLRSLWLEDLTVTFTPSDYPSQIVISNISCRAEHSTQDVLYGTVGCTIGGLDNRLDFELFTASRLYEWMEEGEGSADGADALVRRLLPCLRLLNGEEYSDGVPLRLGDGRFAGSVTGDLGNLDSLVADAQIVLKDAVLGRTSIPSLRGSLFYADKTLKFLDGRFIMPRDEMFTAAGQVDFRHNTATGLLSGSAHLATLLALGGSTAPRLPAPVIMTAPIEIIAVIDELPLDEPKALQAHGVVRLHNVYVNGLVIAEASVRPTFQEGRLLVEDLQIKTAGRHPSVLSAEGTYLPSDGTFSAEVTGTLNPSEMLEQFGGAMPAALAGKLPSVPVRLSVAPTSPLTDWRRWDAAAECSLDYCHTGPLKWEDLNLKVLLKEGRFALDAFTCRLAGGAPPNHFLLKGESGLDSWLALLKGDEGVSDATAALHLEAHHGEREAMAVDTRLVLARGDDGYTFALEGGRLDIRPELMHNIFEKPSGLSYDEFPLAWERCLGEEPLHSTFEMPPWPLHTGEWSVDGRLAGKEVQLLDVPLEKISSAYYVNGEEVVFSDIRATLSPSGTQGNIGYITITYDPFSIIFTDMELTGAPEDIEPWLYDRDAREIYRAIWADVKWSKETPPHIAIPDLQYHDLPRGDYLVILKGTLDSRNAAYRGFQTSSASCRLDMTLPSPGVSLTDIRICANGEDALTGRVDIGFDNGVDGTVDLAFPAGEMDAVSFLKNTLLPEEAFLERVSLAPQTHFSCKGRFSYGNELHFALAGRLDTPQMRFDSILLNDLQGEWSADNRLLRWDLPRARFYDGQLTSTGNYDFGTHSGECIAVLRKSPLESLQKTFGPTKKEPPPEPAKPERTWWGGRKKTAPKPADTSPLKGYLGCDAHVRYYTDWADRPIQLQGNARVEIQEADLWRVPVLSSLGSILFTSDLGRISKLSADLNLNGERITVHNLVTDGTLISLRGNGVYHLDTKHMHFNLTGEFIRSSSIFRWLLSPVAWLINAELSGTPEDFSWRTTTMRKIFSSDQPSMNRLSSELEEPSRK